MTMKLTTATEPAVAHDAATERRRIACADALLRAFALRTGVDHGDGGSGDGDPTRRYLWTDAFAVLASLGLHRRTGQAAHLERAVRIVTLVHETLGRHRDDDPDRRTGWISGLGETDGSLRPTVGGLRIGKPRPERRAGEVLDERLEWDRDGQYFHYLTKWMLALNALSRATGDPEPNMQAIELAHAAAAAFIHRPRGDAVKRIHWKMSIDLSRPLVAAMGQHDPLDALVVFARLQADQRRSGPMRAGLGPVIADLREMCGEGESWATRDPLGIGDLLSDASQLVALRASGDMPSGADSSAPSLPAPSLAATPTPPHADLPPDGLLATLLADAHRSVVAFAAANEFSRPLELRLAFREIGLAIGLRAVPAMHAAVRRSPQRFGSAAEVSSILTRLEALRTLSAIADHIEETWMERSAQATSSWTDHLDINSVMLAASLVPDALLPFVPPREDLPSSRATSATGATGATAATGAHGCSRHQSARLRPS
jgi:hypothetical protein